MFKSQSRLHLVLLLVPANASCSMLIFRAHSSAAYKGGMLVLTSLILILPLPSRIRPTCLFLCELSHVCASRVTPFLQRFWFRSFSSIKDTVITRLSCCITVRMSKTSDAITRQERYSEYLKGHSACSTAYGATLLPWDVRQSPRWSWSPAWDMTLFVSGLKIFCSPGLISIYWQACITPKIHIHAMWEATD